MSGGFLVSGLGKSASITSVGGSRSTSVVGRASYFFNDAFKGEPRFDNLFLIRLLGRTPYVEMLKDIVKKQVGSTGFKVRPKKGVEEPSDDLFRLCESAESFFRGNFNSDGMSWNELMNVILDDILDFDSGVLELVPDEEGFLKQVIPRDGLTFTKNPLSTGLLPEKGSVIPSFYQFSLSSMGRRVYSDRLGVDVVEELNRNLALNPLSWVKERDIPFSRDQIVWFSESPVSYSSYGRGRTQKIKQVVEILLNGDIHRARFFSDNEFHKGVLQIKDGHQNDVAKVQEAFSQTRGDEHSLPVIGGAEANYISIDPSPDKMQFLESHKFYMLVALMAYGLNEAEAGNHENANLSVSEEMKFNVWRRTTHPLLDMIENKFNREVLPFMREFHEADGLFEFVFEPENDFMRKLEQEVEKVDWDMGVVTLNELRRRQGVDDFGVVGDFPKQVFESLSQRFPGFVAQLINPEMPDAPEELPSLLSVNGEALDLSGLKKKDFLSKNGFSEEGFVGCGVLGGVCSYRDLFSDTSLVEEALSKDALRNERGGFPHVVGLIKEMRDSVAGVFDSSINSVLKGVERVFPAEEQSGSLLVNVDSVLSGFKLEGLGDVLKSFNARGLEKGADFHRGKLEKDLNDKLVLPSECKVVLDFSLEDTFTYLSLMERSLMHANDIESTIVEDLRRVLLSGAKKGEGVSKVSKKLRDKFSEYSRSHAELVARTELLSSSRYGSQALGESTDLIVGKEWLATEDSRTRPWHAAMNGVIVPKEGLFSVPSGWGGKPFYQPKNYPKSVRVVGDDQPFNCRCDQVPVLREDMPNLRDFSKFNLKLVGLSKRQVEVWCEFNNGEKSFAEFWKSKRKGMGVKRLAREFGMSNSTILSWDEEVGLQ